MSIWFQNIIVLSNLPLVVKNPFLKIPMFNQTVAQKDPATYNGFSLCIRPVSLVNALVQGNIAQGIHQSKKRTNAQSKTVRGGWVFLCNGFHGHLHLEVLNNNFLLGVLCHILRKLARKNANEKIIILVITAAIKNAVCQKVYFNTQKVYFNTITFFHKCL